MDIELINYRVEIHHFPCIFTFTNSFLLKLGNVFVNVCVCVCISCSVMPNSLRPHGLQPTRLLYPWDFPGKDTGVGCHFLPQGIFPTQGLNPDLLHCRQTLYHLSYEGNPFVNMASFYFKGKYQKSILSCDLKFYYLDVEESGKMLSRFKYFCPMKMYYIS